MERPKPRGELVIFSTPMMPYGLTIAATTGDAQSWLNREAPLFGKWEWIEGLPYTGALLVSLAYDPQEVARYLMSFTTEEGLNDESEG